MTDLERWVAMFDYAGALKAGATTPAATTGIVGRSITFLVNRVCDFWAAHQATLIPALSQLAIAAFQAMIAARADIDAINPPGPR